MGSSGEEVKVLGKWASPFSNRVELALKVKGVKYIYSEEDLANKSHELLHYNPIHKKVPVLIHNGNPIAESLIILEYIDDTWKTHPLLPNDSYGRAHARFWSRLVEDKCMPALWNACGSDKKGREKALEEAEEALKLLENELEHKKFFGGDTIGLVDISANFIAYWVEILQDIPGIQLINPHKFPNVYRWSHDFSSHPLIKEALPPRDKLYAFFKPKLTS